MWEIVPCTRVISVIARQLSFLPWLNIMRMENRGRTLVANDSQVFTGEELSFLSFWFSVVQSSISLDDTSCNYDSLLEPQVESNYCQAPIQDLSLLEPHVESRPKPKLQILECKIQALVHYVTIAREIPQPKRFFIILHRCTNTSEQSGPNTMSTMVSIIMRMIRDDEISVLSLEYIEQIMELFCLSIGEIWCIQRIFGVRMLKLIIIVPYLILSFALYPLKSSIL